MERRVSSVSVRCLVCLSALWIGSAYPSYAQTPPGLGFAFRPTAEGLVVRAVAADGPLGGEVKPGDVILSISDRAMGGLPIGEIDRWIEGVTGTPEVTTFALRRGGIRWRIGFRPLPYDAEAFGAFVRESDAAADASLPRDPDVDRFNEAMEASPEGVRFFLDEDTLIARSENCRSYVALSSSTSVDEVMSEAQGRLIRFRGSTAYVECGAYRDTVAETVYPLPPNGRAAVEAGRALLPSPAEPAEE